MIDERYTPDPCRLPNLPDQIHVGQHQTGRQRIGHCGPVRLDRNGGPARGSRRMQDMTATAQGVANGLDVAMAPRSRLRVASMPYCGSSTASRQSPPVARSSPMLTNAFSKPASASASATASVANPCAIPLKVSACPGPGELCPCQRTGDPSRSGQPHPSDHRLRPRPATTAALTGQTAPQ